MDKLFLDSKEVARLLDVSQQQAYKIIREMNKALGDKGLDCQHFFGPLS